MSNAERRTVLIEELAATEHQRWSDWQSYFFTKCTQDGDGNLVVPAGYVAALQGLIDTPYADLSEDMKSRDRREVERYMPLLDKFAEEYVPEMST